jgi:archaellum component FlaC
VVYRQLQAIETSIKNIETKFEGVQTQVEDIRTRVEGVENTLAIHGDSDRLTTLLQGQARVSTLPQVFLQCL